MKKIANYSLSYVFGSEYTNDLHKAVEERDLDRMRSLIEDDGIYVDMIDYSSMGFSSFSSGSTLRVTALHLASKNGFYDGVTLLLEKGANPRLVTTPTNSADYYLQYLWLPLHYALRYEHFPIVNLFIQSHNMVIDDKALEIIKKYGLIRALPYVSSNDLSANFINEVNIKHSEIEALNWYDNQIAEKRHCSSSALGVLYGLVCKNNNRLAEGILQHGDYYFKNKINESKYDLEKSQIPDRIKNQFPEICNKLISNAREIDGGVSYFYIVENTRKAPVLFLAILTGNREMVMLLLKHGADLNATVNGISASNLFEMIFEQKLCEFEKEKEEANAAEMTIELDLVDVVIEKSDGSYLNHHRMDRGTEETEVEAKNDMAFGRPPSPL